jgi:hypothetical protein
MFGWKTTCEGAWSDKHLKTAALFQSTDFGFSRNTALKLISIANF